MTRSIIADTTVLIDCLRGLPAAIGWLTDQPLRPTCAEVTRVEVIRGLRSHERRPAEQLFSVLTWAPLSEPISRRAGDLGRRYRRSQTLGVADLIIGATALELNASLATTNVKHFPMWKDLKPPY